MFASTDQRPITPREVTRLPIFRRNGKRPHLATVYRWMKHGIGGVKLEYRKVGSSKCTTEEAVLRFIERLTHCQEVTLTPAQRQKEIARADKELRDDGID